MLTSVLCSQGSTGGPDWAGLGRAALDWQDVLDVLFEKTLAEQRKHGELRAASGLSPLLFGSQSERDPGEI